MIRRLAVIGALAAVLVVLGSCTGPRYFVDHDTRHDFAGYRSYAWFKLATPPDKAAPPSEANTILTRRIRWAIDAELSARGFTEAAAEEADFFVTYSLVLQSRMVMYHTGWSVPVGGWGWGWGWGGWGVGWGGGRTSLETYTEGTIVVDVLDTGTRRLVWRGTVENAFSRPNPDDERIRRVVARVLEGFPPSAG
ncbi:MAG: DUF4136 domain-containing protein [Thermoanaerobaculales bacterium]|jgi:hypothetical protein|nr:DUF4136 domain-containing protein [Thermoanaerobaculales bacterium]